LLQASETPSSTAEKIEAVDGAVSGTPDAAAVAEVIAAAVPVEENDADALVAEHEAAADPTIVPEHHVESDAATEAKIEAEATEAEKTPAKTPEKAAAPKAAAKAPAKAAAPKADTKPATKPASKPTPKKPATE
jgi:small subunit ribosomal protein S2